MKIIITFLVFSLGTLLMFDKVCSKNEAQPASLQKEEWFKIEKEFFSFSIPTMLKENTVEGIDSSIWEYSNEEFSLSIERGDYTSNLSGNENRPNYREENKKINGQNAKVISFNYEENYTNLKELEKKNVVAVHFPQTDNVQSKLTFWVSFRDIKNKQIAHEIIESINFKSNIGKD